MGGGSRYPTTPGHFEFNDEEREREREREEREEGARHEREQEHEREKERERAEERSRKEERERAEERSRKEEREREKERREPKIKGELVKIYPQANPRFNLTAEGDTVVLSKASEDDDSQLWYKDGSIGEKVKDSEGHSSFMLVNKGSHLALKHVAEDKVQVSLTTYREGAVDNSLLWTLSDDVGDGYKAIRPADNPKLNLDADHADKEHGGVKEHNRLILYKWKKQDNQKWKLVPVVK